MAGDWLKMEAATPDKPEVLAITARMGWEDPDLTVGKLFRVWRWFDQQTVDGNAAGVTTALLNRIAGVNGFAEAMESVGWLVVFDTGIALPNFSRHCGQTAKDRALTAKRVAKHKASASDPAGNVKSNGDAVTTALPREEKRREEKNNKQLSSARADMPAGFLRFWSAWPKSPRKVAKAECAKRWRSRRLEAQAEAIVAHVESIRGSRQWRDGYEPAPLTYLNQERWRDGETADQPRDWWLRLGYGSEELARRDGKSEGVAA